MDGKKAGRFMDTTDVVGWESEFPELETTPGQALSIDEILEHVRESGRVDAFLRQRLEKEIYTTLRELRANAHFMTYIDISVVVPLCDPCCFTEEHKPFPIVFGPDWLEGYKNLGLLIGLSRSQIATVARALRNGSWLPACWQCGSSIDLNSEEGFHIRRVSLSEYFNLDMVRSHRIPSRIEKIAYRVFGKKCVDCQREAMTLDHIVAYTKGGGTEVANLQPMCDKCNNKKTDRDVEIVSVNLTFPVRPLPSESFGGFIW